MKQVVLLTGAFLPATSKLCKIWLATRLHKTTEQTLRAVVGSATLQQSLIANRIVTAYPRLFERPRSQAFRWHWVQAMRELKGVMAPSSTLVHVMTHTSCHIVMLPRVTLVCGGMSIIRLDLHNTLPNSCYFQ